MEDSGAMQKGRVPGVTSLFRPNKTARKARGYVFRALGVLSILIALGVLLAAGGGVFAFLASSDKLALSLALGASVMYLGFRRASAPARPQVASGP